MTEVTTMMKQLVQSSVERSRVDRSAAGVRKNTEQAAASRQELPADGSSIAQARDENSDTLSGLEKVVDDLHVYVQNLKREIRFSVDEGSGRTIITVVDAASKELVRQIPAEDVINVSRNLQNHLSGVFVRVMV